MFVRFMFKNFKSFKNETVLDMTAVNAYKEHPSNLINISEKEKYISVAAIYGANASGKSKLYEAFSSFQRIVRESFNNTSENRQTSIQKNYNPFKFDSNTSNTEFELIEILDSNEYRYGFEYNSNLIVTEWLYKKNLNTGRTITIFERTNNEIDFGPSVKKECSLYKDQVPKETLVLSFFNRLNLETKVFNDTYEGIMDTLVISSGAFEDDWILNGFLPKVIDEEKSELLDFLSAIDTGIKNIRYEKNEGGIKFITSHIGEDGNEYELNLADESEGTEKSIALFICARIAIINNSSMFVDELNVKLHPLLLKFIIDLFYVDNNQAQLIYTTHDTTLMDKKFFRRDQILFVQKDKYGYSELTALSDFKVRSDASFEKDYLAGVYGGIPNLKEFKIKEGE